MPIAQRGRVGVRQRVNRVLVEAPGELVGRLGEAGRAQSERMRVGRDDADEAELQEVPGQPPAVAGAGADRVRVDLKAGAARYEIARKAVVRLDGPGALGVREQAADARMLEAPQTVLQQRGRDVGSRLDEQRAGAAQREALDPCVDHLVEPAGVHLGACEHGRARRPALAQREHVRRDLIRPRGKAGVHVGGRDDRRHALPGKAVEQGIALPVVGRAVVDAREHMRVHVHERPGVHSLVHAFPIDAGRGGLEHGIAANLASIRTFRRLESGYPAPMRVRAMLTIAAVLAVPATAQAGDLYVDPANAGCSDTAGVDVTRSPATPWCSPTPAQGLARPGDTVHLASTTYHSQLRPLSSGTESQPIVYLADGPVTIVAPAGIVSVMLTGVHDVVLRGFTVRAAAPQAIWVDNASRILIDRTTVANDRGVGVQIKGGIAVTVTHSRLINNARAGLFDMSAARDTTLSGSLVSSNGRDGRRYDGDGVELNSTGATVTGNRITRNGDGVGFEHGIYAGSHARSYTISGNTIGANAGADVKAAGGPGLVAGNRLTSGLFGIVLSDNPAPVTVQYNLIQGRFQHGILLTTGSTAARARLWNNTVQQIGRSTRSGNASAVFVASAAQLDVRNNLFAYTNSDALGTALMINDRSRLGSFLSSTNWYASTDRARRRLAWNGSRVTFRQWRSLTGQDSSSIDSPPPRFAPSGRVASRNMGAARGTRLGLSRDIAGTAVDPQAPPDIGAFQHA
ncbi:MAG: hypothetical protein QOE87_1417 [Gaiellales bacterium]|nr:hypothetical protein [Gaiellales bacterium]